MSTFIFPSIDKPISQASQPHSPEFELLKARVEQILIEMSDERAARKLKRYSQRKRCDARLKQLFAVNAKGLVRTKNPNCRSWAMKGKTRCRMHGGASTGAKTAEGKARAVAAMVEGRRKWVERMNDSGHKFSCGRKPGTEWKTAAMRKREAIAEEVERVMPSVLLHELRKRPNSPLLEDVRQMAFEQINSLKTTGSPVQDC